MSESVFNISLGTLISIGGVILGFIGLILQCTYWAYRYLINSKLSKIKNFEKEISYAKINYRELKSKTKHIKSIFNRFIKNLKNSHRLDMLKFRLQYQKEIFDITKKYNKKIFNLKQQNQKQAEILSYQNRNS